MGENMLTHRVSHLYMYSIQVFYEPLVNLE